MRKIEIYATSDEINSRIEELTIYYTTNNIAHVFGVLPFHNMFMLTIYAEGDDQMKVGCLECFTEHIQHFSQVINDIEYMEDNPNYGTRFIIEYDREKNEYDLTYYKKED